MSELPTEERAGGLVFRKSAGANGPKLEYLLVTSNSNKNRWLIPAGHVEPGETAPQAALREVVEEAGVAARLIFKLGEIQYCWTHFGMPTLIITTFFLMEHQQTISLNPEGRTVGFFEYQDLIKLNLWDETRRFMQQAHRIATDYIQSSPSASH